MHQNIHNLKLVKTCDAYPEQYDVYYKDIYVVGYLRLRNGNFTVTFPNVFGIKILSEQPKGDGCFDDDEREHYLSMALNSINKNLSIKPKCIINAEYYMKTFLYRWNMSTIEESLGDTISGRKRLALEELIMYPLN